MDDPAQPNAHAVPFPTETDYDSLLLRAGASGLNADDRAELIPALKLMDEKIALLRRNALESSAGFTRSPVSE
ncbi:hypothetical protein J2T08_005737 [Neorhizobium galegae]|uniref:hypothetical protein n=1 Tax=Neorhizobium galegae TaxID=399 RepID=UPI00278A7DF2|nr:hypothetical protein [Neorhizobium galegae]MDQ0137793.1 hypothetical protein [Neorhizobium galegae]